MGTEFWMVLITILIATDWAWISYLKYLDWKEDGKTTLAEEQLLDFGFTILFIIYMVAFLILILCCNI